jgi:hypothetical protein
MNGMEIFLIGLFCGAYGMFTLLGVLWCGNRKVQDGDRKTKGTYNEE